MSDNELLEKKQIIEAIPELPKGSFYLYSGRAGVFPVPGKTRKKSFGGIANLYPGDSIEKIRIELEKSNSIVENGGEQ